MRSLDEHEGSEKQYYRPARLATKASILGRRRVLRGGAPHLSVYMMAWPRGVSRRGKLNNAIMAQLIMTSFCRLGRNGNV